MSSISRQLVARWAALGPRFLPFADAASPDLPLSRLLRLSLFQVAVGMALALLVGALNRVMIVELGVPAGLVAVMVALPVLWAPARALIGFRSDHHRSALGWRRVPFMWMGALLQFGGLALMPFTLLVLAGKGDSVQWPAWVGQAGAAVAFLLVGAGLHTTQTAGLALATDLAPRASHPKVVGLMYVMLLAGTLGSAFVFGWFLSEFTPGRLVQVIQACALATLVLNAVAMWKQEPRRPASRAERARSQEEPDFMVAWRTYVRHEAVRRRLSAVALGTMGFAMQDVLLEPYGGQVLGMTVGQTTWLTALMALGGLAGFGIASRVLGRGADAAGLSLAGAALGLPAFVAIVVAAGTQSTWLFAAGVALVGLGGGIFAHGTLTLTMSLAAPAQVGLALGAWGAVQATSAGVAVALGGIGRDVMGALAAQGYLGAALATPATGYAAVYIIEFALLLATCMAMRALSGDRLSPAVWPALQPSKAVE
jgi:BCD family chlorophyll transporter-like MFS transporter